MKKFTIKAAKGFTLIELLTVISIIGILTGLLTVSFLGVRVRGRDAQRKSDVKAIQSALELYRADNDAYPATSAFSSPQISCGGQFAGGFVIYMQKVPCDPSTGVLYNYSQVSATSYILGVCLENTNDKDGVSVKPSNWGTFPNCPTGQLYYVSQNP